MLQTRSLTLRSSRWGFAIGFNRGQLSLKSANTENSLPLTLSIVADSPSRHIQTLQLLNFEVAEVFQTFKLPPLSLKAWL